jgi:acetyl esterase/lipase
MPHVARRIGYGPDPNQFGDLWLPEAAGPHRVVVFIHGGYWRARYSLDHADHFCQALAAEGCAVWTIEYRRVGQPGGGWPGTFADVLQAARHVEVLAATFPIDGHCVVLTGHSAGGHLALWAVGAHRVPQDESLRLAASLPVRGVVALAPVADLQRAWELRLSGGAVGELLGGSPADMPERYSTASPVNLLPAGVPQVLIHGTIDEAVPYELSERYRAAASAAGDRCELLALPGLGHFELIDPHSTAWPGVVGAIKRVLSDPPVPQVGAASGWPRPR